MDEPDRSLEQAAALRLRASEIRELARGLSPGEDRDHFNKHADALEAQAFALDGRKPED